MSGDTLDIIKRLAEPFPREAIKSRQGGGGTRFDYIAGPDIIRRLTRATGGHWDWVIKSFEFRPLPPTRSGAEQSLVVVMGELTIPGLGTRAGIGVQKVSESAGEDLVKGASTDALKKAATLFGVALELYGPDFEEDAPQPPRRAEAARPAPAATTQPAPAQAVTAPPRRPPLHPNGGFIVDYEPTAQGQPAALASPAPAPDDPLAGVVAKLREMETNGETWDAIREYGVTHWQLADAYGRQIITATMEAIKTRRQPAPAPAAPTFASRAG